MVLCKCPPYLKDPMALRASHSNALFSLLSTTETADLDEKENDNLEEYVLYSVPTLYTNLDKAEAQCLLIFLYEKPLYMYVMFMFVELITSEWSRVCCSESSALPASSRDFQCIRKW